MGPDVDDECGGDDEVEGDGDEDDIGETPYRE